MDFYYWDTEKNEYQLLPTPKKTTLEGRMASLFGKDLITDEKPVRMAYMRMIREWLILNATCSAAVYINKDYVLHSKGDIIVNLNTVKQIPDYIRIAND